MVNIRIAESVQGWMSYKELEWLAKEAQKYSVIVEIGSYLGRSTRALGDNTTGTVYAIDDFKGPRDMVLPPAIRDNIFELFCYNNGDLINNKTVMPMISSHANAQVDVTPDMVFIDGSHIYEDVKRDILLWHDRLAPGGLLCGHDYTNIPDVRQAVSEIFSDAKVAKDTSIWYVQK